MCVLHYFICMSILRIQKKALNFRELSLLGMGNCFSVPCREFLNNQPRARFVSFKTRVDLRVENCLCKYVLSTC